MCTEPGMVKNTYGTGCFLLMNSGDKPILSKNNLITTIAWKIGDKVNYALEGSIFVGGSVVQWLRDGLGVIRSSSEVEELASRVPDTNGVYFVPALTGMGAPWWDQYARGTIVGISRGTTTAHIARAALEGIAYQTLDIMNAMSLDAGIPLRELKVDGGSFPQQPSYAFQADILGTNVIRPKGGGNYGYGSGLPCRTCSGILVQHRGHPQTVAGRPCIRTFMGRRIHEPGQKTDGTMPSRGHSAPIRNNLYKSINL